MYVRDLTEMPVDGPGVPDEQIFIDVGIDNIAANLTGPMYQFDNGSPLSNLATLDLVRAQTHTVPAGIALATHVKTLFPDITVYTLDQMRDSLIGLPEEYYLEETAGHFPDAPTDVPLEFYCSFESLFESGGRRMGKLCSLISGETLLHFVRNAPQYDPNFISRATRTNAVTFLNVVQYLGEDWNWAADNGGGGF